MAKIGFYLSEEEKAWVKAQGPGFLRTLVKKYRKAYPERVPIKEDE